MVTAILVIAISALFLGGTWMVLQSKSAAELDARVSIWIGYRLFPKRMRKRWGSQEAFRKFLASEKVLMVYKIAGTLAVLLAAALTIFSSQQ